MKEAAIQACKAANMNHYYRENTGHQPMYFNQYQPLKKAQKQVNYSSSRMKRPKKHRKDSATGGQTIQNTNFETDNVISSTHIGQRDLDEI